MSAAEHPPLWAWMVQEADGRWGIIGAIIPGVGQAQLVFGSRKTAEVMRPVAAGHHQQSGRPVRLVRFDGAAVVEDLPS